MTPQPGDLAYDVRIWAIGTYKGEKKTTYTVRWRARGTERHRTFATRKLAESFRSALIVAAREGEAFDTQTGLPRSQLESASVVSWYEHACAFMDMKWPRISPRHRKSIAEGLVTVTCAAVSTSSRSPDERALRHALLGWSFNTGARDGSSITEAELPAQGVQELAWVARASIPLQELAMPRHLRPVLDALALNLDGTPASASTLTRKRSALFSALDYAVERGHLTTNPMTQFRQRTPRHTTTVDRRVVINPEQARRLLLAVRELHPCLEAFFACMYYSGLRPAEVRHLRERDLTLPGEGWGLLQLSGSTPTVAAGWSNSGATDEDRQLKHRAIRDSRPVPAPPELVAILGRHLADFPPGHDGRLFVTRTGRAGVPLAGPFATPQPMGMVYYVWDAARQAALTDEEYRSPLARRPYDLRHAAVSLWLNAGVPPTQVAEWAGHSVNVLLRVYAKCVYGQEEAAKTRIQSALQADGGAPRESGG